LKSKAPAKASLLLERTSGKIFPIDNLMRERERGKEKFTEDAEFVNHEPPASSCTVQ
jgi:hypothetical protein